MPSAQPEESPGLITSMAGAQDLVGYVVDVGQPDGKGRAWLDVEERHANRNGMLHGGIIAMLLDAACGWTASLFLGKGEAMTPLVTVSLTTSFIAGAPIGRRVTAIGHLSGGGSKIAYVQGELHDDTGRLVATATGVFKKVPAERFT